MSVHYSPGAHPVAVTPHGFAVLAEDTTPALAARIHALLTDGRGLGGVLEALTGAYGTSLSAVPPFAVALAERGSVRLAVRGGFALDVDATTPESVSGEGVTTWTERVIAEASRVSLVGEADAPPPEFPVADGVVLAAALVWVPGAASAKAADRASDVIASPVTAAEPARTEPAAVAPRLSREPEQRPVAEPEQDPAAEQEPQPVVEPAPRSSGVPRPSSPAGREAFVPGAASAAASVPSPAPAGSATPPTETAPGLIDSAVVLSLGDTLLPAESTMTSQPDPDEATAQPVPDPVLDATVVRSKEPAPAVQGDHDGETISLAEARALRNGDSAPPPLAPPRPPAPGRIRVSTGQVMTLDRTVVIGRRPRSTRVSGTDLPHLVAVDSPQQDISRSHVELRVEGDSILATDLHTTNGTTLVRPGVDPMRLHPGEGTVVVPGDLIDLGDGITVAIEELP